MSVFSSGHIAHGWVLVRVDGVHMGFTDHDEALVLNDPSIGLVTLNPETGFLASASAGNVGMSANDMDVRGILKSDVISDVDIGNGIYDGAEVRYYWVNWADPTSFSMIEVWRIAELTRNQNSFIATLEGLSAKVNEPVGLRLTRNCGLDFGEAVDPKNGQGCGLDLSAPAYSQAGVVARVISDRSFAVVGMTLEAGLCTFGKIRWAGGSETVVKSHTIRGVEAIFELDYAAPAAVVVGATFTAEAGCDKSKTRCAQYSNLLRRLAFPIPPDNVATKYARDLSPNSGGSGTVGVGG